MYNEPTTIFESLTRSQLTHFIRASQHMRSSYLLDARATSDIAQRGEFIQKARAYNYNIIRAKQYYTHRGFVSAEGVRKAIFARMSAVKSFLKGRRS